MLHLILGMGLFLCLVGVCAFCLWVRGKNPDRLFLRGGKLITQEEAAHMASQLSDDKLAARVGPLTLSLDLLTKGILILGAPGAGKGLTISLFLASISDLLARGVKLRLIVWDPRGDFLVFLNKALPAFVRLVNISPVDSRGMYWAIAKDFTSEADADEVAELLIPEESKRDNQYFPTTGRILVAGVVKRLQKVLPGRWSLRHLIRICSYRNHIVRFLTMDPATRDLAKMHLKKGKTGNDVLSTIASNLGRFKTAAAGWSHAKDGFSIKEFMNGSGEALILPFSHVHEAIFNPINALMMKRVTQEILQRNDPSIPTVTVFDEYRMMTKVDLGRLLLMGRGAGNISLFAFQDIAGLEDALERSKAQEILALLQHQLLLRTEGIVSPQYESETIGDEEVIAFPPIDRDSKNARIEKRRLITADEFRALPLADWDNDRIEGYMKAVGVGMFKTSFSFRGILDSLAALPEIPPLVMRPDDELELPPLTEQELRELGL